METHALVHIGENKIWTTVNDLLMERCEYHLVFLGRINFVERQRPLIIVDSNEYVKTLEIGQLTFDETDTLHSVIHRGLGVGVDPNISTKNHPYPSVPIS